MEKNLDTIKLVLEEAFYQFEQSKLEDVVLAIGNTGCGKSTLMGAMIVGSDKLEKKKIDWINKQGKKQKKQVIDYKDDVPKVLKIGHDNNNSETFYPSFY